MTGFLPRDDEGAGDADAPPRRTEATRAIEGVGAAVVVEGVAVVDICATGAAAPAVIWATGADADDDEAGVS